MCVLCKSMSEAHGVFDVVFHNVHKECWHVQIQIKQIKERI